MLLVSDEKVRDRTRELNIVELVSRTFELAVLPGGPLCVPAGLSS